MASQTKRKPATRRRTSSTKKGSGGRSGGVLRGIGGQGPWWAQVLRWLAFLTVAGILAGALTFFVLYRAIAIPDPNAEFQTQTTKVYYSDGKHQIGSFATQDRENVGLSEIPASMQAAAIAAEDRTFYTNRGIDFKGIIRAVRDNTTSGEIRGGGSTITQQYVKVLYLTQERSYKRKLKEAVLSVKIHNQLGKKDILEGYLNTIYFGNGAYGVEVASKTYFGKPASDLNYAQSAMLATIINSPSYYDPYNEGWEERLKPRFDYVLDGMLESGAITEAEREKFRDKVPGVVKQKNSNRYAGTKGYLLDMTRKQLAGLDFSDAQIRGGGLRIVTTVDYEKQKSAVAAVKQVRPGGLDELHTALVSIQPGTGAVRSLYGGPNYLKSELNWATLPTQPGSTFKMFALIAALQDGYGLQTQLNGNSPLTVGDAEVENQGDSGGSSFGTVTLERATAKSINTAFVDLTQQMSGGSDSNVEAGAAKVLKAAQDAGIPAKVIDNIGKVAVTSLGFAPVPPIDMANAYATVAAGGVRADWYLIEKVSDENKTELYKHEVETKRTIDKDVAGDVIKAMRGVTASGGTGTNGNTVCPTGGKTGTATAGEDPTNQYVSSSWFAGYTPKLATTVMYNRGRGNEDLEGYLNPFFGGTYPALTFKAYMNSALQDEKGCGEFIPPGNIRADKGTTYVPPAPKPKKTKKSGPKPEPKPTKTTAEPDPDPTIPAPKPTKSSPPPE
ncbi:MAG: transglycosylase domain-containing protein [Aeromicrobium sp.]